MTVSTQLLLMDKINFNFKEHKAKIGTQPRASTPFQRGGLQDKHSGMCVYIKMAPYCRSAIECIKSRTENEVKETQNDEIELQRSKDRKVHYAIG